MTEIKIMRCPQCHAEATKVGAFWICPQRGQLSELKSIAPLRSVIHGGRERYLIVIDALYKLMPLILTKMVFAKQILTVPRT